LPSSAQSADTTTRAPTRWAGLAPDARRAERRILLLDAAYDLLGTEGWGGTTVRAVCQASRLNPRYFYESFADLEELALAVFDRLVDQLRDEVRSAIDRAGEDPRAQVRAAVETTVGFVDEDRRRGRILYAEALGSEALNRRRKEAGRAIVALVEHEAAARHSGGRGDDVVGRVAAAVLVGGLSELLVGWLDGTIRVSRQRLVDDATELFLALGEAAARIATRRAR